MCKTKKKRHFAINLPNQPKGDILLYSQLVSAAPMWPQTVSYIINKRNTSLLWKTVTVQFYLHAWLE